MAYLAPEIPALSITYKTGNIRPLGNNFPLVPSPGSLWDFLNQHEDFSIFKYLVTKAQLEYQFNEIQAEITVFIPSDRYMIKSKTIDSVTLDEDSTSAQAGVTVETESAVWNNWGAIDP